MDPSPLEALESYILLSLSKIPGSGLLMGQVEIDPVFPELTLLCVLGEVQ